MPQRPNGRGIEPILRRVLRRGRPNTAPSTAQPDPAEQLLLSSPLFDHEWYRAATRIEGGREAAVRHYLRRGHELGASPHPLFVPDHYTAQFPKDDLPEIPFLHFVQHASSPNPSATPLSNAAGWLPPELPDLETWIRARGAEWAVRRASVPKPLAKKPSFPESQAAESADEPLVSIVMVATADADANRRMVEAVRAQQYANWELLIVHDQRTRGAAEPFAAAERTKLIPQARPGSPAALNDGLQHAAGEWVAWICDGDRWEPHHLQRAIAHATATGSMAVCSGVETQVERKRPEYIRPSLRALQDKNVKTRHSQTVYLASPITRTSLAAGHRVAGSSLVVSTSRARSVGGFDESLPNAYFLDFVLRLAALSDLPAVPAITVQQEEAISRRARAAYLGKDHPTVNHPEVDSWHDVVLNRHLIDWGPIAARPATPGLVTVVMATYTDWFMTVRAVESVVAAAGDHQIQILVVDNGCDREAAIVLDSLPLRFPQVTVIHNAVNHGFALGNNLALNHTDGEVMIFLNNDTEVYRSWLSPLLDALKDPEILGAQALCLYPSGSVQVAGVVFPECGGIPSPFLQGFPREDAAGIDALPFRAVSAAALAVRRADVLELRGFDPIFRNGMEDVDFGLRLSRLRPGRFCVRTDSRVVHHESKTPGRYNFVLSNRRLLLDRWGADMPGDDVEAWASVGYDLVRHQVTNPTGGPRRLDVPSPVLVRAERPRVVENAPRLRWAIKNPAPAHEAGEHWGDTAFARHVAAALRRLGQDVVIDNRDEFERPTGTFDDVTLLLRGLTRYQGTYGSVNLIWLISHPESFHRPEAEAADLVFAASNSWARRKSAEWSLPIEPLLQATDPAIFHPDRAQPDTGHRVLFVGGSRKVERPIILEAARADLPLTVYGPDWEGRLPERFVKATSFPNDELGAAYRAAGVVLNDHWEIMRTEGFVSNRLFDAVAAGARVISDRVDGIEELFGRSVQVAHQDGDVARLASLRDLDAVFGDDEARRATAARIHAEHSFDVRAKALLDGALRVRATLSESRRRGANTRPGGDR